MTDNTVTWVNLPNGEPAIVVWYWNEMGQTVIDPTEAIGVTASDRFRKFHSFKISENTFDEVRLQ